MANDYSVIKTDILTGQGTVGSLITIRSVDGDVLNGHTISAGAVALSYIDVQSSTGTGGAIPFNDPNGVDSGNNTNWNFSIRNILYSPGAYNPIPHMGKASSQQPGGNQILQGQPNSGTIKTDKPSLL